jgi:UDP-glucose:glycoprotein glucosyltransferase
MYYADKDKVVGPISQKDEFVMADFVQLLQYEHDKRIKPVIQAATELGVLGKVHKYVDP